jgi:hypothetical protein
MPKHKLVELQKVIDERIGSLSEEVVIRPNVKLNQQIVKMRSSFFNGSKESSNQY